MFVRSLESNWVFVGMLIFISKDLTLIYRLLDHWLWLSESHTII